MTMTTISIPPGVLADFPDHDAASHWIAGDKIRFRDGRLQNFGGWRQATYKQTVGVPRAMACWTLLSGQKVTAAATEKKVYVYRAGERYDITPLRDSATLATDALSVVNGSSHLTIARSGHGESNGDIIRISGATNLGGINPNGEWTVLDGSAPNSLVVDVGTTATSTVAAGGGSAIDYEADIHTGLASATGSAGWGVGVWGGGKWGGSGGTTTGRTPGRIWWLEPWGEDLIICYTGGGIWRWRPSLGLTGRASTLSGAPDNNIGIVVSPEDRHLIVFGADGDSLALQWPDQGTLTSWAPGVTSTANTLRLLSGSRIVSALKAGPEILIWTDDALYGLRYTGGTDFSHSLRQIAGKCTILAPKAAAENNGVVFWWGRGKFFVYDGASVSELPCTVKDTAWAAVDVLQIDKIVSCSIPQFGEIIWFYPTVPTGENTDYVKCCIDNQSWDMGELGRTAIISRGSTGQPVAASADGWLYEHDIGTPPRAVSITLRCRKYANSTPIDVGPISITPTTNNVAFRARGRHIAIRISGTIPGAGENEVWFAESSSFTLGDGAQVMRISRMITDVAFFGDHARIGSFRFDVTQDGEQ